MKDLISCFNNYNYVSFNFVFNLNYEKHLKKKKSEDYGFDIVTYTRTTKTDPGSKS